MDDAIQEPAQHSIRTAIKRNSQMRRRLSTLRRSISTEAKESTKGIDRKNMQLIAKLVSLKSKQGNSVTRTEDVSGNNENNTSQDISLTLRSQVKALPSERIVEDKYYIPSWQRAEILRKNTLENEEKDKIYGRLRSKRKS